MIATHPRGRVLTIEDYVRRAQEERAETLRRAFARLGVRIKSLFDPQRQPTRRGDGPRPAVR